LTTSLNDYAHNEREPRNGHRYIPVSYQPSTHQLPASLLELNTHRTVSY